MKDTIKYILQFLLGEHISTDIVEKIGYTSDENDFNKYKESIQLKLAENQKVIGDLKLKINSKSKAAKDIDEVEINKLEKRNTDLKLKLENYEYGPEQKWALFKVDFNNEMDDLGKSISNMAERNMKK